MNELHNLQTYNWNAEGDVFVCVAAAGFEARAVRGAQLLASLGVRVAAAFILEFREIVLPENESNHACLTSLFRDDTRAPIVKSLQIS